MTTILVEHGSIGDCDVDVLVNASNTALALGSGVSAAIRATCGPGFQQHLDEIVRARGGSVSPGDVVVTGAHGHPRARHVAHVAVMDYRDGSPEGMKPTLQRVRQGCAHLWDAIEALGSVSVGMVALGAGTGGLGLHDSVEVACETLRDHLARGSRVGKVVFVAYALHEYANTLAVVRRFFDVDTTGVPDEILAFGDKG
jgi:O-acetyl-ADP-ribose deacetylase